MRVAAVVQAIILGLIAGVVLAHAGVLWPRWSVASAWLIWVVVGLLVVSVVMNASSPSVGERRIWVPVTLMLLVSCLVVVLSQ